MSASPAGELGGADGRAAGCDEGVECITCGDSAVPLRVLGVDAEERTAVCADDRGEGHTVDVGLVPDAAAGDVLLVHAGAALARLEAGAADGA